MKIKMFACISVILLLTTSCGKVRYPNYYTLSLAPP